MTDPELWWAVDPLLLQPTDGKVRLLSPAVPKRLVVTTDVAQLMLMAQAGIAKTSEDPVLGWSAARYRAVTTRLAASGYLVETGNQPHVPAPWNHWGPLAWAYHDTTATPSRLDVEQVPEAYGDEPRPSSFPGLDQDPILLLPRLSAVSRKSFIEVLERRRTHRHFCGDAIALEEFSDVLRYTFGPLRFADAGPMGVLQLRAAASGGARGETEAYVFVLGVESVTPGLYAYDTLRHGLVPLRFGDLAAEIEHLTLDQGFFAGAAFGVLSVARSDRMSWKYRNAGAYRVLMQNTGNMAQVFSMVCASMDLGAALTGAIRAEQARAALALAAPSDLVTFAMACGRPQLRPDGLPASTQPPTRPFTP